MTHVNHSSITNSVLLPTLGDREVARLGEKRGRQRAGRIFEEVDGGARKITERSQTTAWAMVYKAY